MNSISLIENKTQGQSPTGTVPSINWQDSLPIQHLLDVISSILAKEYIMIAKQNPGVFTGIASRPSVARNDERLK